MDSDLLPIFRRFVQIGHSHDFDQLKLVMSSKEFHSSYCRGSLNDIFAFANSLCQPDLFALIKTLTVYERQNIGGYNSTSPIIRLYEMCHDPERKLADWVLQNTNNEYLPFGGGRLKWNRGAKSIQEYDKVINQLTLERNRGLEIQRLREELDQAASLSKKMRKASHDIFNAARRGDERAVDALIAKGAIINNEPDQDGKSLLTIALESGNKNVLRSISAALEINQQD